METCDWSLQGVRSALAGDACEGVSMYRQSAVLGADIQAARVTAIRHAGAARCSWRVDPRGACLSAADVRMAAR